MSAPDPADKGDGKQPSTPPAPAGPATGESFGHYLLRERELRGFSLQQVSDTTRIGMANLKALEADDLSRLPARVFVLGYIRAYAHAIGLSPDEAVLRFEEQSQRGSPAPEDHVLRRSRKGRVIAAVAVAAVLAGGVVVFLLAR